MPFDPLLAEIRFGAGLSPVVGPPDSTDQMMARLTGPDTVAGDFPIESFDQFRLRMDAASASRKLMRQNQTGPDAAKFQKAYRTVKRDARRARLDSMIQTFARRSFTNDGFRERLMAFWNDHFTVRGKAGVLTSGGMAHGETYIRPHMTGRFEDLLFSAVTSPLMVHYLDQQYSVGPDAPARAKMPPTRGLNENLAREVLELHTLGVDGPYDQRDVRQLAELFTGLTIGADNGPTFRKAWAQPGAENVLGHSYGGDPARLDHIREVLVDLARHPATAQHIVGKLAVHFLGDQPDTNMVQEMAKVWSATDGDLRAVYDAMLGHPAAWSPERLNIKPPIDFLSSALRALAVPAHPFRGKPNDVEQRIRRHFLRPLQQMGQPWEEPTGPDGWPEEDAFWVTPQGLIARLEWALRVPQTLLPDLPDPRDFVAHALGADAPETVRFAARAAENRHEGIALVLLSPAFQRR